MKKKINGRVSAFWHLPFTDSDCTMISESDVRANRFNSLQHIAEVVRVHLNPVEVAAVLDSDPITVAEFSEAAYFAVSMDLTSSEHGDRL